MAQRGRCQFGFERAPQQRNAPASTRLPLAPLGFRSDLEQLLRSRKSIITVWTCARTAFDIIYELHMDLPMAIHKFKREGRVSESAASRGVVWRLLTCLWRWRNTGGFFAARRFVRGKGEAAHQAAATLRASLEAQLPQRPLRIHWPRGLHLRPRRRHGYHRRYYIKDLFRRHHRRHHRHHRHRRRHHLSSSAPSSSHHSPSPLTLCGGPV